MTGGAIMLAYNLSRGFLTGPNEVLVSFLYYLFTMICKKRGLKPPSSRYMQLFV